MNAQDISEIFNSIRKSSDDDIITQPLTVESLKRIVLVFKDSKGLAHILIESGEGFVDFDEIKGIGITNKSYTIKGFKQRKFYEYFSRHEKFHIIFFPFITDILSHLIAGADILSAHKSSLKLWKNCFENPEENILPVDKEIGLIGEFLFLIRLIMEKGLDAVEYWNGPSGGIDFVMTKNSAEVKTTLKNSHTHTINGIDQLMVKKGNSLFLASVQLQTAPANIPDALSLSSKFNEILEYLSDDPVITDIFRSKIEQTGISVEIIGLHDFRKYTENDFRIFHVNDEFPKITQDSFKVPLSSRVSKVRYDVDMGGLAYIDVNVFFQGSL